MTKEQLLMPRIKVLVDYPQYTDDETRIFIKGDIAIQCNVNGALTFIRTGRCGHMSVGVPCVKHPEKYPEVFQSLPWYSQRKVEDMPKYLKVTKVHGGVDNIGTVFKTEPGAYRKFMAYGFTTDHEGNCMGFDNIMIEYFEPATEEEYLQYIGQAK